MEGPDKCRSRSWASWLRARGEVGWETGSVCLPCLGPVNFSSLWITYRVVDYRTLSYGFFHDIINLHVRLCMGYPDWWDRGPGSGSWVNVGKKLLLLMFWKGYRNPRRTPLSFSSSSCSPPRRRMHLFFSWGMAGKQCTEGFFSNAMKVRSCIISVLVLLTDYRGTAGLYRNTWPKHTSLVKMYDLESVCQNERS